MATSILLTGFPGFIGRRLVQRLAADDPGASFNLLVEGRMAAAARSAADGMAGGGRLNVVAGDITERNLGLTDSDARSIAKETTHVYHLAAVYHLAVPIDIARRVNVDGTLNVVDFSRRCGKLERLHYASTCYVAGDRSGTVYEHELQMGQRHKNHYESTKFQAEVVVRDAMGDVPATIYRPAIVVGDSGNGETQKFDGPYYALRLISRLARWHMPLVRIGGQGVPANVVPVDFVVDAMAALIGDGAATGKTLQLTDPEPPTMAEVHERFCEAYAGRGPRGSMPTSLMDQGMRLGTMRRLFGDIPREMVSYLTSPVHFDTRNALELLGARGVRCPRFADYVRPIVDFFRAHEDDPAYAPIKV